MDLKLENLKLEVHKNMSDQAAGKSIDTNP